MGRCWRLMLLPSALVLPGAAPQGAPAETLWFTITTSDGAAIGHSSQRVTRGPQGSEAVNSQEIVLQEEGTPVVRVQDVTTVRLNAEGRTTEISNHSASGRSWTRTVARIGGGKAEIVRTTRTDTRRISVPLPPGVRFDGGNALLKDWDPAAAPRLDFLSFNVDAMAVEPMSLELAPGPRDPAALHILRKRYDGTDLRAIALLRLDRERKVVAVTQPMFGTAITTRATDQATAQKPHAPFRVLGRALIKSPFRIPDGAAAGHIRYRFGFRDGIAFTPAQTGEQRAAASADGTTIDICETCGPGLASDPETLAHARRPTVWLQSDDARIRRIVDPIVRRKLGDRRTMEELSVRARAVIEQIEFSGHHSALEAMQRRAGDCTEAAVLLAAFGRAAGIPARVVNGLVYSRPRYHGVSNVFMPHSWVAAWVDGEWRSYDAALETFDSTHIALTVGDGDARSIAAASQLASLLVWQEMTEVRERRAD